MERIKAEEKTQRDTTVSLLGVKTNFTDFRPRTKLCRVFCYSIVTLLYTAACCPSPLSLTTVKDLIIVGGCGYTDSAELAHVKVCVFF